MEEDFYDEEYNYFDSTVADLKEQLKKEVKQEIQDKMKTLEKENEELQDVKKNWEKIKEEYRIKESQLNHEKETYQDRLKREYFQASFEEKLPFFFDTVYVADYNYKKQEKCNECDENRQVDYISRQGEKIKGSCKCNHSKKEWFVEKGFCYTKVISLCSGDIRTETYVTRDISEYDVILNRNQVLDAFSEEKISKDYYKNFFITQKEAQKYVDYLNSIED